MNSNNAQSLLKKIVTALIITFVTVGGGIMVTRLTGPVPLSVTQTLTQKESTFDVTGESEITSVPDQVEVRLGVNAQGVTVQAAQEQANQVINQVTKQLKGLGVDDKDIKTQNYNIYPNYDFRGESQRITGYQVNADLLVKLTDFDKLNQAIDLATAQGANQVGGISFSLSKEKEDELRKQAREEAINDAKDSAQELARLAGVKLGKVVNVYESPTSQPTPMFRDATMALESSGAMPEEPTQIQPGSTTFNYTVTLSYETL